MPLHEHGKDYYDLRYKADYRTGCTGYEGARVDAIVEFMKTRISAGENFTLLDYGAGNGLHVQLWQRLFPEAELFFCDISTVAMAQLEEKYPQFKGKYGVVTDHKAAFKDASFDCIVSIEVMEHVESLQAYIHDVMRLLRPGGFFVWTTPCGNVLSIEHLFSFVFRLIERTAEGYRRWKWEDPSHLRRLKSSEVKCLLEMNGFGNVYIEFRAHVFSFLCTYCRPIRKAPFKDYLLKLDYALFRKLKNGASMIGYAIKN